MLHSVATPPTPAYPSNTVTPLRRQPSASLDMSDDVPTSPIITVQTPPAYPTPEGCFLGKGNTIMAGENTGSVDSFRERSSECSFVRSSSDFDVDDRTATSIGHLSHYPPTAFWGSFHQYTKPLNDTVTTTSSSAAEMGKTEDEEDDEDSESLRDSDSEGLLIDEGLLTHRLYYKAPNQKGNNVQFEPVVTVLEYDAGPSYPSETPSQPIELPLMLTTS